jgi:hypothetical protein
MLKYVELCVNLRNSALAKDGLYQYKIITQQVCLDAFFFNFCFNYNILGGGKIS